MNGGVATLFDEHPCGLVRHGKLSKDLSIIIADVAEVYAVPDNEIVHGFRRAVPCNANYGDFVGKFLVCTLDRGRFKIARASTGRPKPQSNGP